MNVALLPARNEKNEKLYNVLQPIAFNDFVDPVFVKRISSRAI
jgi:hypothetical protein